MEPKLFSISGMSVSFISPGLFVLLSLPAISFPATEKECSNSTFALPRAFHVNVSGCSYNLPEKQREQIQARSTTLLAPALYLTALVLGFPANLLALWVLLFRTKKLPSTILLLNLTCCDLMLLLVLPFRIVYHFRGNNWTFGEPFCRLVVALFYGNMYGSVVCLALISIDRYMALVHPFGSKTLRGRRTALGLSLVVWMVVVAAMAPLLASRQTYPLKQPSITTCHDALPKHEQETYFLPYFATLFFVCFLLPLLLVLFCYGAVLRTLVAAGSRYCHAVKVTVLVVVVFVVCLLPSNVLLLLHYLEFSSRWGDSKDTRNLYVPYVISLALGTFNSCLDPFIFYYVSEDFREKACAVLRCLSSTSRSFSGKEMSYSSGTSRSKVTLVTMSNRVTDLSEEAARSH
ncbi:proteinase-activated receptor 4 [Electrophorus electricus]|uniref:Proteinase-activated receptor 4 n=1 Tax=Electrophorus electricus TaxID=8005 RepID=A0A4W4EL08_ELEEL|nr:proteinase-activated receptor 4 [Electrophorus electricus]